MKLLVRKAVVVLAAATLLTACSVQTTPTSSKPTGNGYTLEDNPLRGTTLHGTFQPDWGLPLAAFNDNGDPEGIVYDIVAAAADELGAKLEVEPNDFSTTIPGVQSGKYDVGLGTDATPERQNVVDVVSTTKTGYQFVTVKEHADLPAKLEDFSGLKVAVIAGSSYIPPIEKASETLVDEGKRGIEILTFPDAASSTVAVQSGRADGTLRYIASALYVASGDSDWKVSGPAIILGESGFSVSKDSKLANLWRQAVDAVIASGEYSKILDKYNVGEIAIDKSKVNPAK